MDKPNGEPRHAKKPELATPHTTDDESITTSTASDTLDSWTVVTDKKNPKIVTPIYEDESNIEDLPKYEDLDLDTSQSTAKEEQETEPSPEHCGDTTSATDEFSDEVSIISESDNGDSALVQHPYLREHLRSLNLKFTTGKGLDLASLLQQQQQEELRFQNGYEQQQTTPPNTPIQPTHRSNNNGSFQTRLRKRRSPSVDVTQKSLRTRPATYRTVSFWRRSPKLILCSMIVLIVLGCYGRSFLPDWSLFQSDSDTTVDILERKLTSMELQNNLMRAEIDLLSKQVNHLTTVNTQKNCRRRDRKHPSNDGNKENPKNEQNNPKKEENPESKEPRRPGDWITIEPDQQFEVNIEEFVELLEIPEKREEEPKYYENKQPPSPKHYDDDNRILEERYNKHNGKEKRDFASKNEEKSKEKRREERIEKLKRNLNSNDRYNRYLKNLEQTKNKPNHDDNSKESNHKIDENDHKPDHDDSSKERKYNREDNDNSKERKYKREDNDNSKERKYKREDNDNSKERKYKGEDNVNSKERKYKGEDNVNSKEHYHKKDHSQKEYRRREDFNGNHQQKRHRSHSEEDLEFKKNIGEWHEKLMQNRENARNEQEERLKREKNWYLNRNDGREQWRSDDMNRR